MRELPIIYCAFVGINTWYTKY